MSEIEQVVTRTRRLETLLRTQYHAEGKGLHQLVTSCEERLPHDVIGKLRFIATVRNKVVHEDNYQLDDKQSFLAACDECEKELTPRKWPIYLAGGDFTDAFHDIGGNGFLLRELGRT